MLGMIMFVGGVGFLINKHLSKLILSWPLCQLNDFLKGRYLSYDESINPLKCIKFHTKWL